MSRNIKTKILNQHQVNIRKVRLTKKSNNALSDLKYLNDSVISVIKHGNWWITCDCFLYSKLKSEFEKEIRKFFNIPNNINFEIKSFESDILSFDDGIYPDYT